MADDDTTGGGAKTLTQAEVDAIVRERLKREREKYADYDELRAKAADADKNKGALEKLLDRFTAMETKLKESALRDLRAEVAEKKGLTRAQAKRLVGETIDELMADADDLIASFRPSSSDGDAGKDGGDGKDRAATGGDSKDGDAGKSGGDAGKTGNAGKTAEGGKDGAKSGDGKDDDSGKKLPPSGRPTEKLTSGAVPAASGDKSPAQIAEEILSRPF